MSGSSNGDGWAILDAFTTIDEDLEEIREALALIAQRMDEGGSLSGGGGGGGGGNAIVDTGEGSTGGDFGQGPPPLVERTKVIDDAELPNELIPIAQSILTNVRDAKNGVVDMEDLPVGLTGTAVEGMSSGESGRASFTISGTDYIVNVQTNTTIKPLQRVKVIDDDGTIAPANVEEDNTGISIAGTGHITDNTTSPGEDNAAMIDLGRSGMRTAFDVYRRVNSADDTITVEVSTEQTDWRPLEVISQTLLNDTPEDILQAETTYRYVRAYAGDNYDDDSLGIIEIVSSGI